MNADGMADEAVVPSTRVNKAATAVAESAEERDLTEGKYCRIGVDASDSEPEQVSIGASREITTGSVTVCRDRLTQRRSRMSQGSRTDLCGGRLATAVPTAILENLRRTLRSDEPEVFAIRLRAQLVVHVFLPSVRRLAGHVPHCLSMMSWMIAFSLTNAVLINPG